MDKHVPFIVEDLLPLYHEGLLSKETTVWLEEQMKENEQLQKLARMTKEPLIKEEIPQAEQIDKDEMFKKINRKLSLYQIIFVALSFLLAIQTALLNGSNGFILWYTVLGVLVYLFYSDMKIVFYFSFIPIFLWATVDGLSDYAAGHINPEVSWAIHFLQVIQMALILGAIHYLFALTGSVIGLIIKKLKSKGDSS